MKLLPNKKTIFLLLIVYFLTATILAFAYFISKKFLIPLEAMTADPLSTFDAHPLTGLVSNLGALLWCCTASICFFTGCYLRQSLLTKKEGLFLISNGVITTMLLMDDFFMLHEYIFHSFQLVFYGLYLIGFIWYCYYFLRLIFKTQFFLLGLAFFFLGSSVFIDIIFPNVGFQYFIEDGFKFFGIATWLFYFGSTSFNMIKNGSNLRD